MAEVANQTGEDIGRIWGQELLGQKFRDRMDDMKGMDMAKKPAAGAPMAHKAMGTVKKVDAKAGVVTLAHEPIKSLNWPSMTMGFKVKDKMLMDKLTDGKKVEFEFMQEDKDYVITGVK